MRILLFAIGYLLTGSIMSMEISCDRSVNHVTADGIIVGGLAPATMFSQHAFGYRVTQRKEPGRGVYFSAEQKKDHSFFVEVTVVASTKEELNTLDDRAASLIKEGLERSIQ